MTVKDFSLFSRAFADIVSKKIPTAKHVIFISNEKQLDNEFGKENVSHLTALFHSVCRDGKQCGIYNDFLMLAFTLSDGIVAVALISKLDPLFASRVKDEWLSEIRNEIEHDFLLLKQARIDSQTGLFNLSNLITLLDNLSEDQTIRLTLVVIPSLKSSFQLASNHLHKCVSALQAFIPDGVILHHLGNAMFAIVFPLDDEKDYSQFTHSLVAYLKREGFGRVSTGSSHSSLDDTIHPQVENGRILLDQAWAALQVALKRGPFGFCDFSLLAHPENHPLARPDQNLVRRLRRLWTKSEKFCLVHFRSDKEGLPIREILGSFLDTSKAVETGGGIIVYMDGEDGVSVLKWAEDIVNSCRDSDPGKTVSAGIACFPYSNFKKSEILFNCRKALAHAAFFGNSGVALFDAVSLNISGDIYFSDGDLVKAVKEYGAGLKCDDTDVNLHNSLGVTFAMMNKFPAARSCFERALSLDKKNLMSLYNIGLSELHHNRKKGALIYFKRALDCASGDVPEERALKKDLKRQIGVLASETGDYQLALDYLLPWYESSKIEKQAESVVFNIGQSYYGLNQSRKATAWLQRALQINQYDDRAMHLLGTVYHELGEGDEIALSLCRKSVELEPNNSKYRLGLAHLQFHFGMIVDARENLQHCLKNQEFKAEAQLLLARCYLKISHHKRAVNWFNKIASEEAKRLKFYNQLKQRLIL